MDSGRHRDSEANPLPTSTENTVVLTSQYLKLGRRLEIGAGGGGLYRMPSSLSYRALDSWQVFLSTLLPLPHHRSCPWPQQKILPTSPK